MRAGLIAAVVTREDRSVQLKRIRFDRLMNRNRNGIASQEVYIDSVVKGSTSFVAVRTAQQFVERGFLGDSAGSVVYYSPDAETIAEEAFRNAYCFQLGDTDRKRPNQIALEFEKAKRDGKNVDIAGSIWVDTLKRTLNSIEFRYVGLNNTEEAYKLGGNVQFLEMKNGAVVIDEFSLKILTAKSVAGFDRRGVANNSVAQEIDVHEVGGALAFARWPDGTTYRAKLGTLRLEATLRDKKPAAGARIGLVGTNYASTLDATGETELAELLPGPYKVVVLDSTLATIGVTLPTTLTFTAERDSVTQRKIVAPEPLDYAEKICKQEPSGGKTRRTSASGNTEEFTRVGGQGVAWFMYLTAPDGTPLANVPVTEAVSTKLVQPAYKSDAMNGKTDAGGRYFSCWNFKLGETVQIWVRPLGKAPQLTVQPLNQKVVAVRVIANGTNVVAASNAPTVAIGGTVFDSLHNKPLKGATVSVSGLDNVSTVDDNGTFRVDRIPAGFYTIAARHPLLDSLGLADLVTDLDITGARSNIALTIPSFNTLWSGVCANQTVPRDSGFLHGTVRDASQRSPLPNARIRVSWNDVSVGANKKIVSTTHQVLTKSDDFGTYAACGIPVDVTLDVTTELDSIKSTLALGANASRVQLLDVSLDVPATRLPGRVGSVKGRVTNQTGEGVSGVRVSVDGIAGARSDSAGNFAVNQVQTGTRTVEFVAIGMTPVTRIVEVRENQASDVSIKLDRVTVLEKVEVTAEAKQQLLRDFEDRKKMGFGYVQDSTSVSHAGTLLTAMRTFPSIIFQHPPPRDSVLRPKILFRKAIGLGEVCEANYFVDKHRVDSDAFYNVLPSEVAWIEVYPRRYSVPREFMGGGECGVVALFTKFAAGK